MGFFFGRSHELDRLRSLLGEPAAVIYGLPGIGKSELAHQALLWLRDQPGWANAPEIVVRQPGPEQVGACLFQYLAARLGATGTDPVEAVLTHLSTTTTLLLVDDAHLAPDAVSLLVDGVMRRGGPSRVVVTARHDLPITTTPLVLRLGPLDQAEATALAEHVAARVGLIVRDPGAIARASGGIPLRIRHQLLHGAELADDPIHSTIAALAPDSRDALIRLAAVAGCSQSADVASALVPDGGVRAELAHRFLIDASPERVIVHGAVRDRVLEQAQPSLIAGSRRTAARALQDLFVTRRQPLLAVEATCLRVVNGELADAFVGLRAAWREISAAGLDHLVLPALERLAAGGEAEANVLAARVYVRMARVDDAERALAALPPALADRASVLALRAAISERIGDLRGARRWIEQAVAKADDARGRGLLRLRRALVCALAGDFADAEDALAAAALDLPQPGPRDQARMAWLRAILSALRQDWPAAAAAARAGRLAVARDGGGDLDYLLMLLEIIAAAERADPDALRRLVDELSSQRSAGSVRQRLGAVYLGIAQLALGDAAQAITTLESASQALGEQRDALFASLAGHYLGRALLLHGETDRAVDVLTTTTEVARQRGYQPLVSSGQVHLARALLAAGRMAEATTLAGDLSDDPIVGPQAQAVLAFADAYAGRILAARRRIGATLALAGDREPLRAQLQLDHAELECLGGSPTLARTAALGVLDDPARAGGPLERYRAHYVLAVCQVGAGDIDDALTHLAAITELATVRGLRRPLEQVELLRLATRAGVSDHLAGVLERTPAGHRPGYAGLLHLLGRRDDTLIVDSRAGSSFVSADGVAAIVAEHDLTIDSVTATIYNRAGQRVDGRATMAALLVALANPAVAGSADDLYRAVWGGVYHPLRHRNTLYVSLNRTRKLVSELLGDREVVLRDGAGWRLAPDVEIAVIRRDPRVVSSVTAPMRR